MQIILLESLNKLGKAGEIVSVRDGFANNFLIPQKKAIIANKKNREELESRMEKIKENNEMKINEANKVKNMLHEKEISINLEANEEGNLYGNIGQKIIAESINNKFSTSLTSDCIKLGAIKSLGKHNIEVKLYDNISASVLLEINKKI
tara:strand:- start:185 stop:631 length:447 start_codon:yes stop_codon:yes gene_type:complete